MLQHKTESFTAFFHRYYSRLVVVVMNNGASQADAHDAAQEAMIKACARWSDLYSPEAWVCKVALRAARESGRKRQKERQAFRDGHTLVRTQTNPQNIVNGQLQIVDLLRQLPPEQRRVAALFYDGFTYKEIAEILDKSEATVRSLLRHARERLRSQRRRLDH